MTQVCDLAGESKFDQVARWRLLAAALLPCTATSARTPCPAQQHAANFSNNPSCICAPPAAVGMRYGNRTVVDYYRDLAQRQQQGDERDQRDQQGGQQVQAGSGRGDKKAD